MNSRKSWLTQVQCKNPSPWRFCALCCPECPTWFSRWPTRSQSTPHQVSTKKTSWIKQPTADHETNIMWTDEFGISCECAGAHQRLHEVCIVFKGEQYKGVGGVVKGGRGGNLRVWLSQVGGLFFLKQNVTQLCAWNLLAVTSIIYKVLYSSTSIETLNGYSKTCFLEARTPKSGPLRQVYLHWHLKYIISNKSDLFLGGKNQKQVVLL